MFGRTKKSGSNMIELFSNESLAKLLESLPWTHYDATAGSAFEYVTVEQLRENYVLLDAVIRQVGVFQLGEYFYEWSPFYYWFIRKSENIQPKPKPRFKTWKV